MKGLKQNFRPLEAMDADLKKTGDEILRLLNEVTV